MTTFVLVAAVVLSAVAFAASTSMGGEIPITVENPADASATAAPVSAGVPFARGALADASGLALAGADGRWVPLQTECLSRWPDGSCRWVLLDFAADVAAGGSTGFALKGSGENPAPEKAVSIKVKDSAVTMSNGLIEFDVAVGSSGGVIESVDGEASAEIVSVVELGEGDTRVTSEVVVDSLDVYARGPVRAAVSIYGRRIYSDGLEGPFSQRVEMFAGSPYVRVEDTFIYAHFPGTHAKPENPLALWKVEAVPASGADRLEVASLAADEEAEGLVVSERAVAFWGLDRPFDFSRHTDELLYGEDTQGIALGVGKSCALLVGLLPESIDKAELSRPVRGLWAETTPEVYAESGALGDFAAAKPGEFEKVEEGLRQIMGFWMWFQDNDPDGAFGRGAWHGLFDWGDWQCRYSDTKGKPTGWQYYEGRYGWDCNEMDTTLGIWSAFFHTGRPEYWRAAVAMSRHMMDVDMINVDYRKYDLPDYVYDPHQYSAPWKEGQDRLMDKNTIGMGRRHNVQHWGNGIGDTRHTWNGGIMMYYYLTGNRRAYDAVLAMADMHMHRLTGYACGEYTLSLWCLYNAWQMTGEARYLDEFKYRLDVVAELRLANRGIPPHLDFDKRQGYPEVDGKKGGGGGLAFDYFSNALVDYYSDTNDAVAKELLLGVCEMLAKKEIRYGQTYQDVNYLKGFAWAYAETKDERFLERIKYWLASMGAEPLEKEPSTAEEWVSSTYEVMRQQAWRIRHIGPGVRMAPYAMKAIAESEKPGQ